MKVAREIAAVGSGG